MRKALVVVGLATVAMFAQRLPLEPRHESGASVTGAFEGWFKNSDGSFSFLLGYYNRNTQQVVDIPLGAENRIEPGGPDRGQPTHFLTGRQWGMFTVKVPANFGQSKLTWTLVANGQTMVIPMSLHTDYEISPFIEYAVNNTPPKFRFEESGAWGQGPVVFSASRTVKVGTALALPLWTEDDGKITTNSGALPRTLPAPVVARWSKYRGPGEVKLANDRPVFVGSTGGTPGVPFAGKASTTATFSEPGDYTLHLMLNDYSGDGGSGFQCCWSTGQLRVSVTQ